jgi:hypothetical protein
MSVEAVGLGTGAHLADARRALRMALLVSRASRASRADLRLDTRSCQANANPQPQEKRCAQGRWRRALKLALQPHQGLLGYKRPAKTTGRPTRVASRSRWPAKRPLRDR